MKIFFLLTFLSFSSFAQNNFRTRAHKLSTPDESANTHQYSANDVQAEIDFGRGLAARILTKYALSNNPILQKYISTLGAGIASQIGRPELTFHFAVIETPDVNAYACPGGYIFLTKGLMGIIQNEAELVGVIAHEIAHVNERHVIKKLKIKGKDDSMINGLGALVGGTNASFRVVLQALTQNAMEILFSEGLTKSEELEADYQALMVMDALKYKVSAFADLLENLKKSVLAKNAQVLSKTHPKVSDRLKQVHTFEKNNQDKNTLIHKNRFNLYVKL